MNFETRKIKIETLPEYLSAVRKDFGWSLEDVEKRSGISAKIINSLESGKFNELPAPVYVKGFLCKLSSIYGIDGQELIKQYKVEYEIQSQLSVTQSKSGLFSLRIFQNLTLTPKKLIFFITFFSVILILIYIIWQVIVIGQTPSLRVDFPKDNEVINESYVKVLGETDPGVSIFVNDQSVFVDSKGIFNSQVGITSGLKEIKVVAKSRFGKISIKNISILNNDINEQVGEKKKLEIFILEDVEYSYMVDEKDRVNEKGRSGEVKVLQADNQILFSTKNAGAIKVKVNGNDTGLLGRDGEELNNISFFK